MLWCLLNYNLRFFLEKNYCHIGIGRYNANVSQEEAKWTTTNKHTRNFKEWLQKGSLNWRAPLWLLLYTGMKSGAACSGSCLLCSFFLTCPSFSHLIPWIIHLATQNSQFQVAGWLCLEWAELCEVSDNKFLSRIATTNATTTILIFWPSPAPGPHSQTLCKALVCPGWAILGQEDTERSIGLLWAGCHNPYPNQHAVATKAAIITWTITKHHV